MFGTATTYNNLGQDINIASGATFNIGNIIFLMAGNMVNNGTLTATGASSRYYHLGNGVAQTYSGSGVTTAPMTSFELDNPLGLTLSSSTQVITARVILFTGSVTGSGKITLGNGAATTGTIQIGNTTTPTIAGTFDAPLTFNLGSGGEVISYLRTGGSRTTGGEINPTRTLFNLTYDDNDVSHSLTVAGGPLSVSNILTLTNGNINTTAANLLTVTNTAAAGVPGGSALSYVNGPMARVLPASFATASAYRFPVGKSAFNLFELVNPTTNAGGTVTVQAEAFDGNAGGTAGPGIDALATNRYWQASLTAGSGNFTNTLVRLTDSPLLNRVCQSATQTGTYNSIGGTVVGTGLQSGPAASTTLDFFVMGAVNLPTGTYLVGTGGGASYGTLTAAAADFNSKTITGPVTFSLTDATYPTDTFPITFRSNSGSSSTNTLTISPATGVTPLIGGANATTIFDFSGCQYVIIDGSNSGGLRPHAPTSPSGDLTISNTNTSGATIRFINGATNNTVENAILQGVSTSTSNGVVFFSTVASGTTGNSNNTIQNNDIRGGATATVYGFFNSGTSTAKNANNLITKNRIFNFSNTGIRDDANSAAAIYSGNEIFETATQSTALTGFRTSATSVDGYTFTKNYIHDLNTTSTSTVYGIHFFDSNGAAAVPVISNNMITLSPTAPLTLRGIYDQSATSENYKVYFNSIFIGGTVTGVSNSETYYRSIASVSDVRDNIFVNARTGGTGKHYAIRTTASVTSLTSDYNDIFNTGGTGNVFGNNGTMDVPDLATWRMAPTTGTGKDANSISADPTFVSATDLHLQVSSPAKDAGTAAGGIVIDFDGDSRPQIAGFDIGADEILNTAPTISAAAGVTRQQGSAASNSTIATVNDAETGAGSVTVTVTSANPSNGVTISNIVNTAGTVTADVVADCNATDATFTLEASDGSLMSTDTLSVTVTPDTAPTLTYNDDMVAFNGSTMINPATGPSDNGSVSTIAVQSVGTYTGMISVDNVTGIVSISNAAPTGTHTITIRATDNCGLMTDATFMLTVPNTAPSIAAAAGVARQQGSAASNSTIATVNDTESGAGAVTVTVTSMNPSNGVTISNIVNTGGTVTADVVADCRASNAMFTLEASDGSLMSMDTLSVTVTPDADPTLTYGNDSVAYNGSTMINPATGPSDNGSVSTIAVQSQGTYTGTISVDNVTGIVSISNAKPAGMHTITIRATDNCNRTTDAMFTLTVGAASSNADLSDLTLSDGTLTPAFDSATTSYTANVPNSTSSITVTPTAADANATIAVQVNGGGYAPVTSGMPSSSLPLNVGANTVDCTSLGPG